MKRFWLILLSLGLVTAFSASAFAVDIQFSGSYYAAGMYLDQVSLIKGNTPISKTVSNMDNESTAFYYQRLRVRTDFIVSPGLKLVTRFDALERIWGGARSNPTAGENVNGYYTNNNFPNAGTRAETENISFDWAYIEYAAPIGLFMVGYMQDGQTGTIFGDTYVPRGRIKYYYTGGPVTIIADITKVQDLSYSAVNNTATYTDADGDKYGLDGSYQWKDGKVGMKVSFYNYDQTRPALTPAGNPPAAGNYAADYYTFNPYVMAKIGPVDIQAELNYAVGKLKTYDSGIVGKDINLTNLIAFLDATATFGPIYFGGTFAYVSGDNPGTTDRQEGGTLNGGIEWNPCLIMFNYYDRTYWVGGLPGYAGTTNSGPMSNAWFYQVNAGARPTPKLDIKASVAYAMADQPLTTAIGWASDKSYGWELDVTGIYKITNNLSYMLGVGYWWVGDFYRATSTETSAPLRDDYMVINKLTLTF